ncbi:MAG: hypothetical protein AB7S48_02825 [Bacteroidales bacterium]
MKVQVKWLLVTSIIVAQVGCNSVEKVSSSGDSIPVEKFLKSPFGHDESIAAFGKTLPKKTTVRKLVKRNKHYPERNDTIYQYRYKKSEIFVYKSYFNKEILMAGSIVDPQIQLVNGIHTGITRDMLLQLLKGVKKTEADTIKVSTPNDDRTFSFILNKGKLKKISFASYYD